MCFFGIFTLHFISYIQARQPPAFPHGGSFLTEGPQAFIAGDTPNGRERITVSQSPGIVQNDNTVNNNGEVNFNVEANSPIELINQIEREGYTLERID